MDGEVEIRDLGVDDVDSLIACIRACYAESYTDSAFYDAGRLRADLTSGRLLCVGGVADHRVIGNIGTRIFEPGGPVAEMVAGVVHPEYRGRGLTTQIGARMVARLQQEGIVGVRQFVTGAHDRSQRLIVASGGVPTGVLLGHVPAETKYRGIDHGFGGARIAVIVYCQTYGQLDPLDVYLPERYAQARTIYEELHVRRRWLAPSVDAHLDDWTGSIDHDHRVGLTHVRFGTLAGSSRRPTAELLSRLCASSEPVAYVDVPVTDPRSAIVVDVLRHDGFIFGAVLPGTAATETLRLQRVAAGLVAPNAIVTASDSGRRLLDAILAELDQTRSTLRRRPTRDNSGRGD